MSQIASVRQITEQLRQVVEQRFPYIWVRGEVTNLSRPGSGHLYFSLREGEDHLHCVWFAGQQRDQDVFDPLTGEVLEDGPRPSLARILDNGQQVVCAGRVSVYGPRGAYQLIVDLAQDSGFGRYYLAFEELKRKLAAKGYFEAGRKRQLPLNPGRVAVITALSGAAVHDFIRVAANRGLGAQIRIHPSLVQGDGAVPGLLAALTQANDLAWAEVIVLIRGGGSIQDLQAFNSEELATAIYNSRLPVLTGVGHEVDRSIADFVADLSAATPSHAAQLLWSERREFAQRLDQRSTRLDSCLEALLLALQQRLEHVEEKLVLVSPRLRLQNQAAELSSSFRRLGLSIKRQFACYQQTVQAKTDKLTGQGKQIGASARIDLAQVQHNLDRLRQTFGKDLSHQLEQATLALEACSPLAPLRRGYALVSDSQGNLVRSVEQVHPGDSLELLIQDGQIKTKVQTAERTEEL